MQERLYFYSPFSETNITEGNNRSLLLQFILTEILQSSLLPMEYLDKYSSALQTAPRLPPALFHETSSFNKIQEHAALLPFAFPLKKIESSIFSHVLSTAIYLKEQRHSKKNLETDLMHHFKQLIFLLEPFIEECKDDASLLFFLLRRHKEITLLFYPRYLLLLLKKIHPKGLTSLGEYLCDYFHDKGFTYLIPEIKLLLRLIKERKSS